LYYTAELDKVEFKLNFELTVQNYCWYLLGFFVFNLQTLHRSAMVVSYLALPFTTYCFVFPVTHFVCGLRFF